MTKKKKKKQHGGHKGLREPQTTPPPQELKFPPIIPGNQEDLTTAIVLLGNRVRSKLHQKGQQRLIELVGEYPDSTTAQQWKDVLKQVVKKIVKKPSDEEEVNKPLPKEKKPLPSEPTSGSNAETQIILNWVKEKLEDYYLDDEECYDPDFITQLKSSYLAASEETRFVELAKKFMEMSLASEQYDNPLDFDLTDYHFDLEQEPLAPEASSFVESLVRLAFQKVNWKLVGEFLFKSLNLIS